MKAYPVIRNGEWIGEPDKAIPSWDRSFHFGDGLFETFRVMNARPLFFDRHIQRVSRGMERMGMSPPDEEQKKKILRDIQRLLKHVGIEHARMRLTFSRKGGGAYTPDQGATDRLLELRSDAPARFELPAKGDHIGTYEGMTKQADLLSPFKCTNALLYVMAKRWAVENGYDEALILSSEGKVIEAASSNIFLFRENELRTPPTSEGCVDGVMRGVLLDVAYEKGWRVCKGPLSSEALRNADEVFTSNAVQGIRPVSAFQDRRYDRKKCEELLQELDGWTFN